MYDYGLTNMSWIIEDSIGIFLYSNSSALSCAKYPVISLHFVLFACTIHKPKYPRICLLQRVTWLQTATLVAALKLSTLRNLSYPPVQSCCHRKTSASSAVIQGSSGTDLNIIITTWSILDLAIGKSLLLATSSFPHHKPRSRTSD